MDPSVLRLFNRQFGVATSAQLQELGVSPRTIARAQHKGSLRRVVPGLYRLAGQEMTFETRAMAALLHCGQTAFLDGFTAGAIHRLRSMPRSLIHVTQHGRITRAMPPWLRTSSIASIDAEDIVERGLFRVAHPRRMLLRLAAQLNPYRFERAAEDAWHLGLVCPSDMASYVRAVRRPGLHGIATLDAWLAHALPTASPSQSGLELDAIQAIVAAGMPEPIRQHPLVLLSGEVIHLDLAWPGIKFAVEPGHTWWHGGDARMTADYARDRACGEVGWLVIRFDEAMRTDLVFAGQQIKRTYDVRRAEYKA
jgi:hypothetical protein